MSQLAVLFDEKVIGYLHETGEWTFDRELLYGCHAAGDRQDRTWGTRDQCTAWLVERYAMAREVE